MNEDDIKYRQGRSKRQAKGNEKIMLVSCCGLAIVLAGIIIYGLITVWSNLMKHIDHYQKGYQ